jgi:hypothetical protein
VWESLMGRGATTLPRRAAEHAGISDMERVRPAHVERSVQSAVS